MVALEYTPPGNGSEVDYSKTTTIGVNADIQSSFKTGVHVEVEGTVSADADDLVGQSHGTSFEFGLKNGESIGLTSKRDVVDHSTDIVLIWMNPAISIDATDGQVKATIETQDGTPPDIIALTVAELQDPSKITDAHKVAALASFQRSDYDNLLALDPLATQPPTADPTAIDPGRYSYVGQYQLNGPDSEGDPVQHHGWDLETSNATGSSTGMSHTSSVSFAVKTGFNLFGIVGEELKVGGHLEWEIETSVSSTNGTEVGASLKLETDSLHYQNVIDVYYDRLFKVFAFRQEVPPATPAHAAGPTLPSGAIEGTILDRGKPSAGATIELEGPGGRSRFATTSAKGIVRFTSLPTGTYTVDITSDHKLKKVISVTDGQVSSFVVRAIVLH